MEFLGTRIEDSWESDLKYSVKLLSSKSPKDFFSGLKLLASIYEFNIDSPKRAASEKILLTLCKILPSYIKEAEERFDLNKTKIDEALKNNRHPLHLIQRIPRSDGSGTSISSSTRKSRSMDDEDEIKIISVEEQEMTEEALVNELRREGVPSIDTRVERVEIVMPDDKLPDRAIFIGDSDDLITDNIVEEIDEDDEWVSAEYYKTSADLKFIFDDHGKVKEELEEGLSLLNPMEKEMQADLNISSTSGYKDVYTQASIQPQPSSGDTLNTQANASFDQAIDLNVYTGIDITSGESVLGQRCALGDGIISEMDGYVYICKSCKAVFHLTCGKLVINLQGGNCPICNTTWN
ncbi:MAG: hypothetical protein ACFFCS_15185 [Candidatus Hodarchaeota archaeon]